MLQQTLFRFSWLHKLVLLISLAVGIRVALFSQPTMKNEAVVHVDVALDNNNGEKRNETIDVRPFDVFSSNYREARTKFRQGVKQLGLAYESLAVDPEQDLTIDIAVLPGDPSSGWVVHVSGTHGVEGFAGSAVQLGFLQHMYSKQQQQSSKTTSAEGAEKADASADKVLSWKPIANMPTVILVHAFNPFGMEYFRRPNEHNVDLNRNAMKDDQLQTKVESHVNHENYRRMEPLFNPGVEPTLWYAYFGLWIKAIRFLVLEGFPTLKAAMVGSQYYNAKGIFYGGNRLQKSTLLVEAWFRDYLDNNNAAAAAVTWIDVHTGLGPMGVDSLLCNPSSPTASRSKAELAQWFPGADPGAKVSKGYESSVGFTIDYYERELFVSLQNDNKNRFDNVFLMVQEFGTVPGLLVGHALMLENAAFFSESMTAEAKLAWAKRTTGRAFYPQSSQWRRAVLIRGLTLLLQAMERSNALTLAEGEPLEVATE